MTDVHVLSSPSARQVSLSSQECDEHRGAFAANAVSLRSSTLSCTRRVVSVDVARDVTDVMRAFAIRSAVYIGEQRCPYDEEYDGNDFCAAHILAKVDGEPTGCIRVRFFNEFAKIERLCVLKEYRGKGIAHKLALGALEYVRRKGYRFAYLHAQERYVSFWSEIGFVTREDRPAFVFSDFSYVEMVANVAPHPDPVGLSDDPYVLIRPEGAWDAPGVLEQSAGRPPAARLAGARGAS